MGASAATPDPENSATIPGTADQIKNGNEKKSKGDDKEKLSAEQVDLAVAELRFQTEYYLEATQAMLDGVRLGAEQVQDKRIDMLERGPLTTTEEFFFTIMLTIVLEGTTGPFLASIATRAVIRPVMRATAKAIYRQTRLEAEKLVPGARLYRLQAKLLKEKARGGVDGAFVWQGSPYKFLDKIADDLATSAETLSEDIRGKLGKAKPMRDAINSVTRFVEGNLVAAAKVSGAVEDKTPNSGVPLGPENSPGVDIVAAAMASASGWRLTIKATHEAREAEIRHPDTTVDQVAKLLAEYRADGPVNLADIRTGYAITSEAVIWARLLLNANLMESVSNREKHAQEYLDRRNAIRAGDWWGDPIGGVRPSTDYVRLEPMEVLGEAAGNFKLKADPRLVSYLLVRFGREIERWASEGNRSVFSSEAWDSPAGFRSPREHGWWQKVERENKEDLLVQYLTAIARHIPSGALKLL